MSTSSHLPLLREMFPGKLFLDVRDIAKCYDVSPGHIYNLNSAKRLPFKVEKSKAFGLCVSILAMAKYLDSMLDSDSTGKETSSAEVGRRKPGRPRKNGGLTLFSFQSALGFELLLLEANAVLGEVVSMVSPDAVRSEGESPDDDHKNGLLVLDMQARVLCSRMNALSQSLRPQFKADHRPAIGDD